NLSRQLRGNAELSARTAGPRYHVAEVGRRAPSRVGRCPRLGREHVRKPHKRLGDTDATQPEGGRGGRRPPVDDVRATRRGRRGQTSGGASRGRACRRGPAMSTLTVAVIGAGIGGLTAAVALRNK